MGRNLAAERAERIRSQERAELAAHLHDSVLQTLTLMQKRAADPREVATPRPPPGARAPLVARSGGALAPRRASPPPSRVAARRSRTRTASRSTSSRWATPSSTRAPEALVAATREALTNAAKFAPDARPVRPLRRGRERPPRGLRARPRPRLRPRRGPGRPPRACASRSSGAWSATAAPRRDRAGPGEGTEVELTIGPDAPMSADQPTVVIVDDHAIFRSGVRAELEGLVEVLADVGSVEEAVRAITELEPDVVLLDVHMPGGGGVEVIRKVAGYARAALPRPLRLRRGRGRDRRRPRRRPRLRHQVDLRPRARRRGPPRARRRRRLQPRLAGFVLDAFAGQIPAEQIDPELDQLTIARARGPALHRPRLPLQGGRAGALDLGEDRRGPRLARSFESSSSRTATS